MWSHQGGWRSNGWSRPGAVASAFGEVAYKRATASKGPFSNIVIVTRVKAANFVALPGSVAAGAKVAVRGSHTAAYIGHAAGSGDPYDFAATPVQLLWGGSAAPASSDLNLLNLSDAAAFTWDGVSDILIALETSTAFSSSPSNTGFDTYYKLPGAGEAPTVNKSGYTAVSGELDSVEAVLLNGFVAAAPSNSLRIVCDGNSLTVGYQNDQNTSCNYPAQLRSLLRYGATVFNVGDGTLNKTSDRITANATGPLFQAGAIAVLWETAADMKANQSDISGCKTRFKSWCNTVRGQGFRVVALDCLPETVAGSYANFETDRLAVNADYASTWATFCDALVPIGSDATIGSFSAASNTSLYSDGIHLTAPGYDIVAQKVATAILAL